MASAAAPITTVVHESQAGSAPERIALRPAASQAVEGTSHGAVSINDSNEAIATFPLACLECVRSAGEIDGPLSVRHRHIMTPVMVRHHPKTATNPRRRTSGASRK
jgi:hypothetical protein